VWRVSRVVNMRHIFNVSGRSKSFIVDGRYLSDVVFENSDSASAQL
jgi:hypothetical protein